MIHPINRREVVNRMAQVATVRGDEVGWRLGAGVDSAAAGVATLAGPGCALEYALQVTVFARQVAVCTAQLKARRQVVEARSLHRVGVHRGQQQDQPGSDV